MSTNLNGLLVKFMNFLKRKRGTKILKKNQPKKG